MKAAILKVKLEKSSKCVFLSKWEAVYNMKMKMFHLKILK